MASISRVRVVLTGASGLPGVSTFYAVDPVVLTGDLNAFYTTMKEMFPANVTATVENTGDVINDADGKITGSWSGGIGTAHPSANGPTPYSAPSGAVVTWLTGLIVNGHRVRGRTFIVPLWGAAYENDGTLSPATLANINPAAALLWDSHLANFLIWARPVTARAATPTLKARAARLGTSVNVSGSRVTDKAAVLRSRRD